MCDASQSHTIRNAHHSRTADVDVVEPARLLRFGNEDLERLGRRYPRIAARVYRNLNYGTRSPTRLPSSTAICTGRPSGRVTR